MNLESVEIGPVVGGLVTLWDTLGSTLWHVEDDTLRQRLGQGLVARTLVEPDRYREVGLVPVDARDDLTATTTLLLPARYGHSSTASDSALTISDSELTMEATEVGLSRCGPDQLTDPDGWPALADWLGQVCVSAVQRGEAVLLERGATTHQPWPYTLFAAVSSPEGWLSHLEAAPAPPPDVQWWDQASRHVEPDGTEQASLDAPANLSTVGLAGMLMAMAASCWIDDPLEVAVTYTAAPHGPAPLDSKMPDEVDAGL